MSDFMKSAGELSSKISGIRNEYEEILSTVTAAEKDKVAARQKYENFLNRGDEDGMSGTLKRIREANRKIETLPASRENFYAKISGLEDQYKVLMKAARENIQKFENALDQATKDLKKAKEKSESCQRVQMEISNLRNLITKSGDVT